MPETPITSLPLDVQRVVLNLVRVVDRAAKYIQCPAIVAGELPIADDLDAALGMMGILMPDGMTLEMYLKPQAPKPLFGSGRGTMLKVKAEKQWQRDTWYGIDDPENRW